MRPKPGPTDPWEKAGAGIAEAVEGFHAVVVCGDDHQAAAQVALGIARVLTARRRVVIADLVGDLHSLESLIAGKGGHGASDAALYGVSFSRVTHRAKSGRNLFVIPGGTDDVQQDEVFTSSRWFALAREFRRTGALLLLVAPAAAPRLKTLVDALDGAVVVGRVLVSPPPQFLVLRRLDLATQPPKRSFLSLVRLPRGSLARSPRAYAIMGAGTLLLVVGTAAVTLSRTSARDIEAPIVASRPAASTPAPAPPGTLTPSNPADSADAAAFAVEILAANTPEGANFELRGKLRGLPAGTVSPVPIGLERATWYKVLAGAYRDPRVADSLLRAVRRSRLVGDSAGSVVRVPLAFLIDSVPPRGGVLTAVNVYVSRGMHAYALIQPAGDALLYVGAFASAADATMLADSLRAAGLTPRLVYRKGRTL